MHFPQDMRFVLVIKQVRFYPGALRARGAFMIPGRIKNLAMWFLKLYNTKISGYRNVMLQSEI